MKDYRQLTVLRHGHAPSNSSVADFERELGDRGKDEVFSVGQDLKGASAHWDLILVSSAVRTQMTWNELKKAMEIKCEPQFRKDLYHASATHLLEVLRQTPNDIRSVLLIGHNPGVSEILGYLLGPMALGTAYAAQVGLVLPTWNELGNIRLPATLENFFKPH